MEREGGLINRKRVLAAIVLLLLIALVIFLFWWWFWRGSGGAPATPATTPTVEDKIILPPNKGVVDGPDAPPRDALNAGELYITNLARNFAERYGSFSTDRSFQNLVDVMPLSTAPLRARFEALMKSGGAAGEFKGMETRALTITITSLAASRAAVEVVAQRTETDVDLNKTTTYQTLDLAIVKSGEFWYVDSAAWRDS